MMRDPPLCSWKQLNDGTYDLADVAEMIDSMLVEADNERIRAEVENARRGR